jgi:hypothetical protein
MIRSRFHFSLLVSLFLFVFGACQYEVPITSLPTGKIDSRLLGNWESSDGKEKMMVRRLDDVVYIVYYDGDLFRAYHSDVAGTPFVSVQDINSTERKYAYVTWKLSTDGEHLQLGSVNTEVIPKETKDSLAIVELLKKNLQNPRLFGEAIEFRKQK